MVRLFIAINVGFVAAVRAVVTTLDRRLACRGRSTFMRWVASPQFHVTLRFSGKVPKYQVETVCHAICRPWPVGTFTASFVELRLFRVLKWPAWSVWSLARGATRCGL